VGILLCALERQPMTEGDSFVCNQNLLISI
jgi:hypothetical protein